MWLIPERDLPAVGEQVVGIRRKIVGWWTRTGDGWLFSEHRGRPGYPAALPPETWTNAPKIERDDMRK